jgi:hypothetical protein
MICKINGNLSSGKEHIPIFFHILGTSGSPIRCNLYIIPMGVKIKTAGMSFILLAASFWILIYNIVTFPDCFCK